MSNPIAAPAAPGVSPLAGLPAPKGMLVDLARLEREYFDRRPDMTDPAQMVSFGTSGHRGSSLDASFTEAHILAISQAICDYRRTAGTDGPLYMGKDTHALSSPAQRTALEVLAANGVETIIHREDGVTPTPVISWLILTYNRGTYNRGRKEHLADGIVITPSLAQLHREAFAAVAELPRFCELGRGLVLLVEADQGVVEGVKHREVARGKLCGLEIEHICVVGVA